MQNKSQEVPGTETWDDTVCRSLIEQLWALRLNMLDYERKLDSWLESIAPDYQASARNLAHYLALRETDHRALQETLASLGVSSLGRSESHVLANLDKVLGILHRLTGQSWLAHSEDEPAGIFSSHKLLERHTTTLFGKPGTGRSVRIMVTFPSNAADDYGLVRQLVASGMDIARINCAHDGPDEWTRMAEYVRRAAKAERRKVKILMDLGGPKLRTGAIASAPSVLKLRPLRDDFGRVVEAIRVGFRPYGSSAPVAAAQVHVGVDVAWLAHVEPGDHLDLIDARGADRSLLVVYKDEYGVLAECCKTAYLTPDTSLNRRRKGGRERKAGLLEIPVREGVLQLARGSMLRLVREGSSEATPARWANGGHAMPSVACTLPEIFEQVCVGERIWFDDGRIGGIIRSVENNWIEVEITNARDGGEKLAGDKGINLPDSQLDLPALTEKDIRDLAIVTKLADLVGLSFAQRGADLESLRTYLRDLDAPELGVILKIETRRGFENLPELLFSAMANKSAGVMIARGDLAVECGYERMAEVQEEILWAAEAAHMPVIWATQVLENLAKTGLPSRAEITDAAMGERAECVMLNKGPHIIEAMRTLDDILRRMQSHHAKKRPLLRALHAWDGTRASLSS